jgi:hypothetical protein
MPKDGSTGYIVIKFNPIYVTLAKITIFSSQDLLQHVKNASLGRENARTQRALSITNTLGFATLAAVLGMITMHSIMVGFIQE